MNRLGPLRPRLENAVWSRAAPARRLARGAIGLLWRLRQRVRYRRPGRPHAPAPRVVSHGLIDSPALEPPLLTSDQTTGRWHLITDPPAAVPDAVTLETLLLAAAAEDLDWVEQSVPTTGPRGARRIGLVRVGGGAGPAPDVVGRCLPWLPTDNSTAPPSAVGAGSLPAGGPFRISGPYRLRPDVDQAIVSLPVQDVERRLAALEPLEGSRTILFLAPFLAVGGAERLLFDLCARLRAVDSLDEPAPRLLIATTEPHGGSLGQTIERGRDVSDGVFLLGDWLPRQAHPGALRHLLRRFQVETLVSWNGTTLFYDEAPHLRRPFPNLRIAAQLYHHAGGWAQHTTRAVVDAVDVHLAINRDLEQSLIADRGARRDRVALVHHGVDTDLQAADPAARDALRARLELPADAVVGGAFIRLHAQKRPLDLVELAHRLRDTRFHLLLVGDGPLSQTVDAALAARPLANVRRLPMTPDARPLYAALDLCVLASAYEGLPVFLLDGLARGLPAVAPAVGDIPLLLRDGGGRATPPGDLDALEVAIRDLLSAERRQAEGALGQRTVESQFSLGASATRYRSLLLPRGLEHDSERRTVDRR